VNGKTLHFHLAGINNQNFLMRDEETATWWQQITGRAVSGPMEGAQLDPVLSDELTFSQWKSEQPNGQVLLAVTRDKKLYEDDWEPKTAKYPVSISFKSSGVPDREIMIGFELNGVARAYKLDTILSQWPIVDHVGGVPLLLVVGPDKKSVRAFDTRMDGAELELFRKSDSAGWSLVDTSGSEWNFQGCATTGNMQGKCLKQITALKDYWFDWKNYHRDTTVYSH
jgi:hypothetical protein